jgi:ceramide glucosyltransferase
MRTAFILTVVVLTGTGGELSITHAMKRIGEVHEFSPVAVLRVIGRALREAWLWVGILLMAVSFFSFLTMLSWYPVSFVVPATSLAYVTGALGAKFLLNERLSVTRWVGVLFICAGVALAWVDHMPAMPEAGTITGPAVHAFLRMALRYTAFTGAGVSLAFYVFGAWAAWRFFGGARARTAANRVSAAAVSDFTPPAFTPPASILKPVRGLDRGAYDNFASFCRQDYPEFEIIFAAGEESDPAVPVIRRLMRDFPDSLSNPRRSIRLLLGVERTGTNDKVAKLCRMAEDARYGLLVVTDSDVRVAPQYLRGVIAPLADPGVGAVTALYRAIAPPTSSVDGGALPFGALMDAVGSSASFAASALVARSLQGLKFAMGSTIATTRECLEEIGGFGALLDLHSDDYELGRRIAACGHRIELAPEPVEMDFPSETFSEYLRHELRWLVGIRHIRPGGHLGLLMTQGLAWAVAAALLAPSWSAAGAWLGAYLGVRLAAGYVVGVWGLRDPVLRSKLWLLPLHDFFGFFAWLASFAVNRVEWRGLKFKLDKGRMIPVPRPGRGAA